ncbi:hypothetical protein H2200_000957 [Cladophialophora chaetospira]|uniref:Fungal N-terminal domain-containing protein n=1 Tax=Cladophialophora chaetospira TaxID=386627 RepID=A0AA38XPU0_9EURO|nr:hypothetical protein H2200_000957 [Cladophialophora chaetospira]
MAEFASAVIGLVVTAHSSALMISEIARTLKHAEQEISSYASEIRQFQTCVHFMEECLSKEQAASLRPVSPLHQQALSDIAEARNVLMKINGLLEKILGSASLTPDNIRRLRRRTWLQYHSRVKRLISELRNIRVMIQLTFLMYQSELVNVPRSPRVAALATLMGPNPESPFQGVAKEHTLAAYSNNVPIYPHVTLTRHTCDRQSYTIIRPFSMMDGVFGQLLVKWQPQRSGTCHCQSHSCCEWAASMLWIAWSLPAWTSNTLDNFPISAHFSTPRFKLNLALTGPNTVPWRAPILKAARSKDMSIIRELLSNRSCNINEVDEFGVDVMHLTLYRPGDFSDVGNLKRHADLMRLWTNAGYHAEDIFESGSGCGTTIEILISIIMVLRAELGLWNDFHGLEALHYLCSACGLDSSETWRSFMSSLRKVPLMESLLCVNQALPSFEDRVTEYASEGTLEEMCSLGIWKRSNPPFLCTTSYLLVANTWHEPLERLCEYGIGADERNSYSDVQNQNLLHALAGCAHWRVPPVDDFLATEEVLLGTSLDPNAKDSNGETFLHNSVLMPYGTPPLDLLHRKSRMPIDWLATDNGGTTARRKYEDYWKLEVSQADAVTGPLEQNEDNEVASESALVPLGQQDLSNGFDFVLARSLQGPGTRVRPSLGSRCHRHGRIHLHAISFDRRDTDPAMSTQWRDHHEDVINFLYDRERDQLSTGRCSAEVHLTETALANEEWQAPRMPGSFEQCA